jgi:hypothetical protein
VGCDVASSTEETSEEMSCGNTAPDIRKAALEILRSQDFFAHLRSASARVGLAGEEKFGVGVYFTIVSGFRPNALRVALEEMTEGSAKYLVKCVAKLFDPGTVCGVCSEGGWARFAQDPTHKVAYVKKWSDDQREGVRFETNGNQLARITRRVRDGRIVENPEAIEGRFACFAEQSPPWLSPDRSRWLTIRLPVPPVSVRNGLMPLSDDEIATWLRISCLLKERAKRAVLLPDWVDIFIEECCDDRGASNLPVFLRAWQTMTLLRSFARDEFADTAIDPPSTLLQADFSDLAVTSLLLRKVCRQGCWLPSPAKIFKQIFPVGNECSVINPITGKGVRYTRHESKPPEWASLF